MEVAAISVDSPYAHRVWAEELSLPYPLISDFGREFIETYGIPKRDLRLLPGTASRSALLIDAQGIIRYVWYEAGGRGLPPVQDILTAVRGLTGGKGSPMASRTQE